MHPVAFTAGQIADALLLIGAPEIETTHVGAGGCFITANLNDVMTIGNFFPHSFLVIQTVA